MSSERRNGMRHPHALNASVPSTSRVTMMTTKDTTRSEEHTSELQSPCNLVCRLLLEKKKTNPILPTLSRSPRPRHRPPHPPPAGLPLRPPASRHHTQPSDHPPRPHALKRYLRPTPHH